MREISYIANVLQSETQKRITVRFEKTDQTFTTTTQTTTQTEQDSQSEERFQVQTQAQNTIQNDASLKFGVSISASYGPSVQAKSNFDLGSSSATTDSNSVSTNYSKDVTTRSVASVTQEVSQQQRLDIINSFKEKFEHGFDNSSGCAIRSRGFQLRTEALTRLDRAEPRRVHPRCNQGRQWWRCGCLQSSSDNVYAFRSHHPPDAAICRQLVSAHRPVGRF
jgi:hypothetical protein